MRALDLEAAAGSLRWMRAAARLLTLARGAMIFALVVAVGGELVLAGGAPLGLVIAAWALGVVSALGAFGALGYSARSARASVRALVPSELPIREREP